MVRQKKTHIKIVLKPSNVTALRGKPPQPSGSAEPYAPQERRQVPGGGGRGDTCDHGLSRRSLEGKPSNELSWRVKVLEKKKSKITPAQ